MSVHIYEPEISEDLGAACRALVALANTRGAQAAMVFSGIRITADPGTDPGSLWDAFMAEANQQEADRTMRGRH